MKLFKSQPILVVSMLLSFSVVFWHCNAIVSAIMPAPSEDAKLGAQVAAEIESQPSKYPILPERGNEEVYRYVRGITSKILNSGTVTHKNEFPWSVKIINDNKTLNAFCTPGGYIYVYTGLIKYLDSEDQLAGVMGHEIAHADNRHSMQQLVKSYGVQALLGVGTAIATRGKGGQTAETLSQITNAVIGLRFSREHETDADNSSVKYLCATEYNAAGAAGFFEKIGNSGAPLEFLSTHPNPGNRVQNIKQKAQEANCRGNSRNQSQYQRIKGLLR